jgi:hypothetical protein
LNPKCSVHSVLFHSPSEAWTWRPGSHRKKTEYSSDCWWCLCFSCLWAAVNIFGNWAVHGEPLLSSRELVDKHFSKYSISESSSRIVFTTEIACEFRRRTLSFAGRIPSGVCWGVFPHNYVGWIAMEQHHVLVFVCLPITGRTQGAGLSRLWSEQFQQSKLYRSGSSPWVFYGFLMESIYR